MEDAWIWNQTKFYMVLKVHCFWILDTTAEKRQIKQGISEDKDSDMERIELWRVWKGSWGLYHGKMRVGIDLGFLFLFLLLFLFFFFQYLKFNVKKIRSLYATY